MSKKKKLTDQPNELVTEADSPESLKKASKGKKKTKKAAGKDKSTANKDAADQQISELKEKYIRLLAEFDNYKKRTVKEKIELMSTAAQDTMAALLPILDDFDRAKNSGDSFSEGVELVYNKLYNTLRQKGLESMETDGMPFDPELHNAITEIPAPSDDMKGHIVDTVEKGYLLKNKIIRHAKVVVGK